MDEEVITILEPTREVLEKADFYMNLLRKILPEATVTLIGSLAIPISVKNEMDILIEINENEDILATQEKIRQESGGDIFGVGPIVDGEGFSRTKKKHGIICELHILHKGDQRVEKYLEQTRRFKSDPDLADRYDKLKRSLNGSTSSAYKAEKAKFFKKNNL